MGLGRPGFEPGTLPLSGVRSTAELAALEATERSPGWI